MSVTEDIRPVFNDEGLLTGLKLPDPPRFRYFQKGDGPMFSWTVEKIEGRYGSFVHVKGKGDWWSLDDDSISAHHLRKDAKARALRLYNAWLEGDPKPW
jgi:hypothetical protein